MKRLLMCVLAVAGIAYVNCSDDEGTTGPTGSETNPQMAAYRADTTAVRAVFRANQLASEPIRAPTVVSDLAVSPPRVIELHLRSRNLTVLPAEIGQLTALVILQIDSNKITALPVEVGNLKKLTSFTAVANSITSLPAEISGMSALKLLKLDNNQILSVPNSVGGLAALTSLWLSNNRLTVLPTQVTQLTALKILNVDGNKICNLADAAVVNFLNSLNGEGLWQAAQTCP